MADELEFRPGDTDNNVLRKILGRLGAPPVPGGGATDAVILSSAATTAATLVDTQATTAALLAASNTTIAGVLEQNTRLTPVTNPEFQSSLFGEVNARPAQAFHVRGRRAGFNAINIPQDIGEFLAQTTDLFPELTGVENLEVVSSSASDTAAGVGTRTLKVVYIDTSNALVQSADITLAGTTPVAAGFFARAILWMEATSGGSSEVSVGTIILRIVGPGATQEQISAGENRSLSSRFMVPAGYTGYIAHWHSSALGGATQDVRLRATVDGFMRDLGTRYIAQDIALITDSVTSELPWLRFPALSRIKASTISSGTPATNRVSADFSIIIIAD